MKYYICQHCGGLATEEAILAEVEHGGLGMCDCKFMIHEWSEEFQTLEPVYLRELTPYIEISKYWYSYLGDTLNTVLRLEVFEAIPKDKRLIEFDEIEGLIKAKLQRDKK